MHRLEVPDHASARGAQRDHRAAIALERAAQTPVVVRRRIPGRREEQIARLVDRHRRPDVGRAERPAGARGPACGQRPGRRHVPGPAQAAAAGVEGAHHSARRVGAHVVADRRAHDHEVACDRGRRGHLVLAAPFLLPHPRVQVDHAASAEIRAKAAGARVEREEARVVGGGEDAERAGCRRIRGRVAPGGDAAAGQLVGVAGLAVDLRVEAPALGPGGRIERDHAVEGGAEKERAPQQQRGRLEGALGAEAPGPVGDVAGAVAPGDLEPRDVLRRDLTQIGVAGAAGIVAPAGPLGPALRRGQARARQQQQRAGEPAPAQPGRPAVSSSVRSKNTWFE